MADPKDLTPEQVASIRSTMNNMALSGFECTWEEAERSYREFLAEGGPGFVEKLMKQAESQGRSYLEVAEELMDDPGSTYFATERRR